MPLGVSQSRPLRIRYRELERFQKADLEWLELSIEDLTLDLMKRVSIAPMDGVTGSQGEDWDLVTVAKGNGKLDMRLVRAVNPDRAGAWDLTTRGIGSTAPVYFLPWLSKHIVKLEIGNDCPIFATAQLTGCSIFTMGEEHAPTIYHAGATGSVKDVALIKDSPPLRLASSLANLFNGPGEESSREKIKEAAENDPVEFWRLLLSKLEPGVIEKNDQAWSEVNKTMYISDGTLAHTYRDINGTEVNRYTTVRAKSVAEAVKAAHKEIKWDENTGHPWGSYLGFRDVHGKWSMYLQENIIFTYADQKTKKRYATSFPIALSQVYPPGMESTNLITDVPSKIANPFTPSDTVVEG